MSQTKSIFQCFVQISDQKYEIVLNESSLLISFIDIYPKLQKIVKIGVNEDIYFRTHEFEVFNELSGSERIVIKELTQLVKNKSIIRIKQKSVSEPLLVVNDRTSGPTEPQIIQNINETNPLNVIVREEPLPEIISNESLNDESDVQTIATNDETITPEIKNPLNLPKKKAKYLDEMPPLQTLFRFEKSIEKFHSIVSSISIGWHFIRNETQCWRKVDNRLSLPGVYTNPWMCHANFRKWAQFYAENYNKLNGKVDSKAQNIFDSLKIVHILDLQQIFSTTDPTFLKISDISLRDEFKDYFNNHLIDLRNQKMEEMIKT